MQLQSCNAVVVLLKQATWKVVQQQSELCFEAILYLVTDSSSTADSTAQTELSQLQRA